MKTIVAITTAALVALAAGHASAQSWDDGAPKASVSYADLDLSRASARTALQQRIEMAVERVCPDRAPGHELRTLTVGAKCRRDALAGAQRQLAAIYQGRAFAAAAIEVGPGKR